MKKSSFFEISIWFFSVMGIFEILIWLILLIVLHRGNLIIEELLIEASGEVYHPISTGLVRGVELFNEVMLLIDELALK